MGDSGHGRTAREPGKRGCDAQLGPPTSEAHAGFSLDEAGQGASARAGVAAPFTQRPAIARIGLQRRSHARCSLVGGQRYRQTGHWQRAE